MGRYTHYPPYSIALEAAQRGWGFEPVQRAMDGDTTAVDLWESDPPWHAEDFIRACLNALERQDCVQDTSIWHMLPICPTSLSRCW